MRVEIVPVGTGKEAAMNPPQYCHEGAYNGFATHSMEVGMTRKGSLNPVPQPADHYKALVQHKIIDSTARTERTDKAQPSERAYKTLGDSGYKGMPNNHGSTTIKGFYKQGAERGKR